MGNLFVTIQSKNFQYLLRIIQSQTLVLHSVNTKRWNLNVNYRPRQMWLNAELSLDESLFDVLKTGVFQT